VRDDVHGTYTSSTCDNMCKDDIVIHADGCKEIPLTEKLIPLACRARTFMEGVQNICGDGYAVDKGHLAITDKTLSYAVMDNNNFSILCSEYQHPIDYENQLTVNKTTVGKRKLRGDRSYGTLVCCPAEKERKTKTYHRQAGSWSSCTVSCG